MNGNQVFRRPSIKLGPSPEFNRMLMKELYSDSRHSCLVKAAEFLFYAKWQNYAFPRGAHVITWLLQEHWSLLPVPITQYPSRRTSSITSKCVCSVLFQNFPKSHFFPFLLGRENLGWLQHGKEYFKNCITIFCFIKLYEYLMK